MQTSKHMTSRRYAATVACTLLIGCTFYTQCPEGNDPGGGTAGSGSGTAGTGSGTAGTAGAAGGSALTGDPIPGEWTDATGDLEGISAGFGNVNYLTYQARAGRLIAGVSERGLWASDDGGVHWGQLGTDEDSDPVVNRAALIVFDPEDGEVFWEAGSYAPGVFRTDDNGDTFAQLGDMDNADAVGIDFTDPDRETLFASQHERGTVIFRSDNQGDDWEQFSGPEGPEACAYLLVQDAQTVLFTCKGGPNPGIFRSVDAAESWERVSEIAGWEAPLWASDGTIYWAALNAGGLLRSEDGGSTWSQGPVPLRAVQPVELPDGRIASVNSNMIVVSGDHGATWRRLTSELPFEPVGIVYSTDSRAFFAWRATTESEVPAGVIARFEFDYEAN